ncbi:hypothetical protein LIER_08209 [Lithospermum erythrorhizon]|uniref:Uncharacterized protein n=1 Tax=Lithospermum erythrorhizon TaxID=34254 RepID=A0AAV3PBC7_LITER
MVAIELKKNSRSPKLELGEIDTHRKSCKRKVVDSVKQLLMSIHHEYDASLAETTTPINQAVEAELAAKVSNNGLNEFSVTLKESICQARCVTVQTQGGEAKIHSQNCIRRQLFSENLEESAKKLEIDYAKMTDRNSLKMVTSELEGSNESLHEVVQEE